MTSEWDPRNVFDVLGDESARRILALASEEALSAEAMTEDLAISQPTVYRRLDVLEEYDLVRQGRSIDEDGHHVKVYETNLESAELEVGEGDFVVSLTLKHDLAEPVE